MVALEGLSLHHQKGVVINLDGSTFPGLQEFEIGPDGKVVYGQRRRAKTAQFQDAIAAKKAATGKGKRGQQSS